MFQFSIHPTSVVPEPSEVSKRACVFFVLRPRLIPDRTHILHISCAASSYLLDQARLHPRKVTLLLLLQDGWALDDDAGGGVEAVSVAQGLLGEGQVLGKVVLVVALVFVLLEALFFVFHVVEGARVAEFLGFVVLVVVGAAGLGFAGVG